MIWDGRLPFSVPSGVAPLSSHAALDERPDAAEKRTQMCREVAVKPKLGSSRINGGFEREQARIWQLCTSWPDQGIWNKRHTNHPNMGPSPARRSTVRFLVGSLGMTFLAPARTHEAESDERHKISSTIRSQHRAGRVSMKLLGPHTLHAPPDVSQA
ncbi:hypothetical protein LY78DRAFT_352519 [Colletotrichum sublineola]|nr:hypothetical protein LY78DRAFT_352519 [Colletotrichum sublineola]